MQLSPSEDLKVQKNQGIQVISRAADILRLLGRETGGLSLGQIAKRVELPRSTVQRIVLALSHEGFVTAGQGPGGIKLGPEIRALGQASGLSPRQRLRPIMQTIAQQTGETVDLAQLIDGQMHFIDQIVGHQRLRTVSHIGERFPLTTTANGKAALACLRADVAQSLIAGCRGAADWTAAQKDSLLRELDSIRNGALATDEDEHTEGVSALGFGVFDPTGDVFALSVPVPSSRYARVKRDLVAVLQTARADAAAAS